MKIIADKNIPYLRGYAEQYGEVVYLSGTDLSDDNVRDADALIVRTVARVDEALLNGSNVKLICSATIGYDHIDTEYCEKNNIKWANAPGCNSGSVAQYVLASLILLSRKHKFDLREKTIGIVGVGNVGKKVTNVCRHVGMKVLLNDPPREVAEGAAGFVSLDTIKKEADIITFHTPLYKEGEYKTYHLAGEGFFDTLGKAPFLINSARGGIVDTSAAKKALREGKLRGFVVDCWENEPDIDPDYLGLADIATPHIAGYSADGKSNAARMSLQSLADFFGMDSTGLKAIKPLDAPEPIIDMDEFRGSENRVYDAVLKTYNPMGDYQDLKSDIKKFKQLRNEYPLRREYPAYTVVNAADKEKELLLALGFKIGQGR